MRFLSRLGRVIAAPMFFFTLAFLSASPAWAAPPAVHHSCSFKYDWAVNQGGVPEAQADWEVNTCSYTMQVKAVCIYIPTGHVDTTYSGEVHGLEVVNKAVCPSPTQLYKLAAGLIDLKDTNTWHQFWPTSSLSLLASHHSAPPRLSSSCNCTGFLNDGQGAGFAASPHALQTPFPGNPVLSVGDNAGAWRVNLVLDHFCNQAGTVTSSCPFRGNASWENGILKGSQIALIQLKSSTGICYGGDGGFNTVLDNCSSSARAQMWVLHGYYFYNVAETDTVSTGNPQTLSNVSAGNQLVICDIACESTYHQLWAFPS